MTRCSDFYLVGHNIRGMSADRFWSINEDGTVGGPIHSRLMTMGERNKILTDLKLHRTRLLGELLELEKAERVVVIAKVANLEW